LTWCKRLRRPRDKRVLGVFACSCVRMIGHDGTSSLHVLYFDYCILNGHLRSGETSLGQQFNLCFERSAIDWHV
jgi:hypothetical protein